MTKLGCYPFAGRTGRNNVPREGFLTLNPDHCAYVDAPAESIERKFDNAHTKASLGAGGKYVQESQGVYIRTRP